jgi:hypothetical protein
MAEPFAITKEAVHVKRGFLRITDHEHAAQAPVTSAAEVVAGLEKGWRTSARVPRGSGCCRPGR